MSLSRRPARAVGQVVCLPGPPAPESPVSQRWTATSAAWVSLGMLAAPAAANTPPEAGFHDALIGAMTDRTLRKVTLQGRQL
jgi:hypothetical protein